MIQHTVRKIYDKYVEDTFSHKDGVKQFLLNHERKDLFISNLAKEISQVELANVTFDKKHLLEMVTDLTRFFCSNAIAAKEKLILTKQAMDLAEMDAQIKKVNSVNEKEPELPEGVTLGTRADHLERIDP